MQLTLCILAVALPLAICQIHIGPIGDPVTGINCYHCDDHGHDHSFPSCTNTVHKCHLDEVCRIIYGDGVPRISCREAKDCMKELEDPLRQCMGGGVEIAQGQCEKCCDNDACVKNLTDLLKTEFPENLNLTCPGRCADDDIQHCLDTATMCHDGEFCQVQKDNHQVMGVCRNLKDYQSCLDHLEKEACDAPVGHHNPPRCFWDCCSNNACLEAHFLVSQG